MIDSLYVRFDGNLNRLFYMPRKTNVIINQTHFALETHKLNTIALQVISFAAIFRLNNCFSIDLQVFSKYKNPNLIFDDR